MRLTAAQVQALQKLAQERGLRLAIRPAGGSPSLPPEARPSAAGAGAVIPANAPLRVPNAPKAAPASAAPAAARPSGAPERASAAPKAETVRRDKPKVGRNDPCWCGSGKKYKSCHMKADERGAEPAADAAGDASDDAG
jgi:hypothetical protein